MHSTEMHSKCRSYGILGTTPPCTIVVWESRALNSSSNWIARSKCRGWMRLLPSLSAISQDNASISIIRYCVTAARVTDVLRPTRFAYLPSFKNLRARWAGNRRFDIVRVLFCLIFRNESSSWMDGIIFRCSNWMTEIILLFAWHSKWLNFLFDQVYYAKN